MPRSVRVVAVASALALAAALLASPAIAGRDGARPHSRAAAPARVHGRDAGTAPDHPTSFERFGRGRATAIAVAASDGREPLAPIAVSGFDALTDLDGAAPSDTTGALGDSFFVTAVNIRVGVYDRLGAEVLAPTLLDSLHPDTAGHFAFDPKVVYDQYADTFLLVYLVEEDSPRLSLITTVAIPNATASDPSTWCATTFPGDAVPGEGARWADYPGVGFSEDRVAISTNQFTFPSFEGRFRGSQILSVPKVPLYDCTQPPPTPDVFAGTQTEDPNGISAFTLQPAQSLGTPATSQLLISFQLAGRDSYLTVWRIKETASGLVLKRANVAIGRGKFPPLGTQGGGSLDDADTFWDTGDDRLISAFYDAARNELFTAHATLKDFDAGDGYPESAVRWYEVNPAGRLRDSALARKGTIGAPLVDLGWPSVASDGSGNLFVTYSRASQPQNEFLSAWVAEIAPDSTAATQLLLTSGLATYDAQPGIERWGDYTTINQDPVDPGLMATFNQYAADPITWQQVVNTVRHL